MCMRMCICMCMCVHVCVCVCLHVHTLTDTHSQRAFLSFSWHRKRTLKVTALPQHCTAHLFVDSSWGKKAEEKNTGSSCLCNMVVNEGRREWFSDRRWGWRSVLKFPVVFNYEKFFFLSEEEVVRIVFFSHFNCRKKQKFTRQICWTWNGHVFHHQCENVWNLSENIWLWGCVWLQLDHTKTLLQK